MTEVDTPYEQGAAVFERIFGRRPPEGNDTYREMMRINVEHLFGDILTRPGLDLRTREIITVAVLAALGRERQLTQHLHGALNVGVTHDELIEEMIQVAHYAGWPAGFTGLALLDEAVRDRQDPAPAQ